MSSGLVVTLHVLLALFVRNWLAAGSQAWSGYNFTTRLALLQSISNPSKNAGRSVDWLLSTKLWRKMWRFRWIVRIWCCVIRGPILPNRDSRYLAVPQLIFKILLLQKNYYWIEFIARLHYFVSLCIILQKPAVCCIMPIGMHTSLPQYPPGVWQLSSRSRQ